MIAPARVAAFDASLAVSAGRLDLPDAVAAARRSLRDDRDQGARRGDCDRRPAVAGDARPSDRAFLEATARQARSRSRRDPSSERVSAAPPDARAGIGGCGRCGEADGTGGQTQRQRAGQCRAPRDLAKPPGAAAAAPSGGDPTTDAAMLDYLAITLSHPRWLAERWLDRYGFDADRSGCVSTTPPAPLTLRANRLRNDARRAEQRLARRGVYGLARPIRARRADCRRRPAAARTRPRRGLVRGAGRSVAAGRAVDRRAPRRSGARHLCLAGRQDDGDRGRHGDRRGLARGLRRSRPPHGAARRTVEAAGATNVRLVQADLTAPAAVLAAASIACSSTRRARGSARCGAIRTSSGAAARTSCASMAARDARDARHAAAAVAPGGRLIYATCSSEPEENESVAAAFLAGSRRRSGRIDARDAHRRCRRRSSTTAVIFAPLRTGTDWKRSLVRSSSGGP